MKKYVILIIAVLTAAESYAGIWQKAAGEGDIPSARYGHQITGIDPDVFLTGGYGMDFKRVYSFRTQDNNWVEFSYTSTGSAPSDRGGHSAVYVWYHQDSLFVFGGAASFEGTPLSTNTYRIKEPYNIDSQWEIYNTSGTLPSLAEHHAVVTYKDSNYYPNSIIVFGGYYNGMKVSSDTYVLELSTIITSTSTWSKMSTTGEIIPLYGHQITYDWNFIILTGGKKQDGTLNKSVYELNLNGEEWRKYDASANLPEGIYEHTSCFIYDETLNQLFLYVYGGKTDNGINKNIYSMQFDTPQREWELVDTIEDMPVARYGHSMAIMNVGPDESNLAMFGGKGSKEESFNDLYFFYFSGEKVEAVTNMAEEKPYNAPNPFNPESEKTKIVFKLETDTGIEIKIRIYTLTGYLVRTKEVTGSDGLNQAEWDGRNEAGDIVANGGYICHISGGGYSRKFKIAILR